MFFDGGKPLLSKKASKISLASLLKALNTFLFITSGRKAKPFCKDSFLGLESVHGLWLLVSKIWLTLFSIIDLESPQLTFLGE